MMSKGKNILKKNLIGLNAKIVQAKNKANIGIEGSIINETKHSLTIKHHNKEKIVLKKNITIQIENMIVDGQQLVGSPEERIKKRWKK
jgi:ribonuclease P protein subunit POP4